MDCRKFSKEDTGDRAFGKRLHKHLESVKESECYMKSSVSQPITNTRTRASAMSNHNDPSAPNNQFFTDKPAPPTQPKLSPTVDCICGDPKERDGSVLQHCKDCGTWQHAKCMYGPGANDQIEAVSTTQANSCWKCSPEQHAETVQALKRGEGIWKTRWQEWSRQESSKALRDLVMPEITVSPPEEVGLPSD